MMGAAAQTISGMQRIRVQGLPANMIEVNQIV
jgi:hypothetical protein